MLEYDDERSGSFESLSRVPDDKTVVLGLVTLYAGYVLPPLRVAGARMKKIVGRGAWPSG